jgi:DNA-directed RNA polymerase specialized sigma24 family protein
VEDDHKPWWQDNPELEAIRRRALDELLGDPGEPIAPDQPDPVVADVWSGASLRELTAARADFDRASARYDEAVRTARAVGLSWAEIGRVLGVTKQTLHRRFSRLGSTTAP